APSAVSLLHEPAGAPALRDSVAKLQAACRVSMPVDSGSVGFRPAVAVGGQGARRPAGPEVRPRARARQGPSAGLGAVRRWLLASATKLQAQLQKVQGSLPPTEGS
ncbi:unnamed protein product, partial [Prorocentrum cordatum]